MSFIEVDEVKQIFYDCYKNIDNMQSTAFWYCKCHEFSGCPTILSFLKNDTVLSVNSKMIFFLELHKIKRFKFYLKHYYKKIVDRIEEMRTFYLEKQYFWTREIHFTVKNDYCNEMIDFLLNLDG